jgi:hypothetical protein
MVSRDLTCLETESTFWLRTSSALAVLEDEVELLLLLAAPPAETVRLGARGLSVATAAGAAADEC